MTGLVNSGPRNQCILTTAYDGYDWDNQIEVYGCAPGSGVGRVPCDNSSCGNTSRENETWIYVR